MKSKITLMSLIKDNLNYFIIVLIVTPIITTIGYAIPYSLKTVLGKINKFDMHQIILTVVIVLFIAILVYILKILQDKYYVLFSENMSKKLKSNLILKIYNSKFSIFKKYSPDDLNRMLLSDIDQIKMLYSSFIFRVYDAILRIILALVFLSLIDIKFTILIIIWYSIFFICSKKLQKNIHSTQMEERSGYSKVVSLFINLYNGHLEYRFLIPFAKIGSLINNLYKKYISKAVKSQISQTYFSGLTDIAEFGFICILFLYYLFNKNFDVLSMLTLFLYSGYIMPIMMNLFYLKSSYSQVKAILDPVLELLNKSGDELIICDQKIKMNQIDYISFSNISIKYDEKTIINNFNCSLRKGFIYILKGPSGAGKSSLIKAFLNLIDFDGTILLNNIENTKINYEDIFKLFQIIPQDISIINDSLFENINLFGDLNKTDFHNFLKLAKLDNIADESLEFSGIVDEKISGGEKKRIAICRFLAKSNEKKIIIFDETFANIDSETKLNVFSNIKPYLDDKIAIVVSHENDFINSLKNQYKDQVEIIKIS